MGTTRLLLVIALANTAWGANLAPKPTEWKAGSAGEGTFSKTVEDQPALGVRGGGEDSTVWRSADLKLEPGANYVFRFSAMAQGSGTIISGLEGVNRDFGAPSQWTTYGFAFCVPGDRQPIPKQPGIGVSPPAALRLGQWHLKGEALFRGMELYPVQAVHRRWGDLVLGEGERLDGGVYTDTHVLHWQGSTIHRTLVKQNAGFNSNRWCFSAGSEVVYKYDLMLQSGEVRANVNYHTGGTLIVSASKDGQNWTKLAEATKVGAVEAKMPAEFFPEKSIYVRLQAEGKNANLQVDNYSFRAQTDSKGEARVGGTTLLEEHRMAAGLAVRADASAHGVLLHWENTEDKERDLHLALSGATGAVAGSTCALKLGVKSSAISIVETDCEGMRQKMPTLDLVVLPAGVHTITVTARENDVLAAELVMQVRRTVISESAYGSPLDMGIPMFNAWTCESGWKVGVGRMPPHGGQGPQRIQIEAARGEYEGAQLVLKSYLPQTVLEKIEIGELKGDNGRIPASAISLYEVAFVKVENPTDYLGEPGEYPDPIPPLVTPLKLQAGRNQPIYILVHVPDDAPAGDYKTTIKIRTDKGEGEVPLALHVYDFALPKETHLRSGFGLSTHEIKRYHKLTTKEQEQQVYEKYLRCFAEHRIAPYSFYDFAPIQVKFDGKGADRNVTLGWDAFDGEAQKWLGTGIFNAFQLHIQGLGGGTFYERVTGEFGGFKAGTPDYERLLGDYLKQLESHLREKGWLQKAYVYWFDEPDQKDYPFVVEGMQRIKRLAPGLVRLMTKHPDGILPGNVDLWCALTPEWTPAKVAERRAAGEEVWWYICCGPKAPYIGEFVEHSGAEMRVWPWQSWQYGVQGILIWSTNYWTSGTAFPKSLQDPWQDPQSYVSGYGTPVGAKQFWGNGDGRYLYPPRRDPNAPGEPVLDGPVSSLRWENLRDGVEDYEYLVLLKETIEKAKGKADAALLKEAEALLTVPASISKDTTHFTTDVRPVLEQRNKIARMIERLAKLAR